MKPKTKQILKSIGKLLFGVLVIVAFFAVLILTFHFGFGITWNDLTNQEKMQEFIKSTGSWGRIIFILISFLQVTFVPIPGMVTILAGNYLFGLVESFILSYIGMLIGSFVAFFLGRKIGRPFVNWVVGDKNTVDMYLKKLKGRELVLFFFMFLLPFFPDDLLCSVAGITSISWFAFIILQVITRFTSIGGTLLFMSGEFIPYSGWGVPVLIILGIFAGILFIISYKYSDKINHFLENLSTKITNLFKSRKNKAKQKENVLDNSQENNNNISPVKEDEKKD